MVSVFGDVSLGKEVQASGGGPPWFQIDKATGKTGEGGEYVLAVVTGRSGKTAEGGYAAFEVEVLQAAATIAGHSPAPVGQKRTVQFMQKFKSTPANLKNLMLAIGFTLEELEKVGSDGKPEGGKLVDMITENPNDGPLARAYKSGNPVKVRAIMTPTETGGGKWIFKGFFQEVPGETLKDCLAKAKAAKA